MASDQRTDKAADLGAFRPIGGVIGDIVRRLEKDREAQRDRPTLPANVPSEAAGYP